MTSGRVSLRASKFLQVLVIAAWFGLAAGLSEAITLLALQETGLAAWQWIRDGVGLPILWISPAFDLVLFTLAGTLMGMLAAALPRRDLRVAAAGFFAWMGFYPVFAATGRLNDIACAVLGLGCAVQVALRFHASPQRRFAFVQRTLPRLAIFVLALAAFVAGRTWLDEHVLEPHHFAQLPRAEKAAPNVLLVVMDTARADHFSTYGYERNTSPNVSRLAQRGALYRNAYSTASWTLPSHASFVTGLFPYEHGADMHPLRPEFVTLAETLDAQGYSTAGFVANTIWCTRASGFAQGLVHHEDYFGNWPDRISRTVYSQKAMEGVLELFGVYRDVTRKSAEDINRNLLAWLDRRTAASPSQPFFIFVNYFDAHEPVFPPAPFDGMFDASERITGRAPFDYNSSPPGSVRPEQQRDVVNAYDGAIAYMDAQVGALWAELERRGLAENTLLVVTADHGESLGEAGLYGHRSSLRLEQIHVPLLLRLPRAIPAGATPDQPVSLSRIPATVAEILDLKHGASFEGESLRKALLPAKESEAEPMVIAELTGVHDGGMPDFWPVSKGNLRSLITRRWHYIERSDGDTQLFDLSNDRKEERNLAATPQGARVTALLRGELAMWFAAADPAARRVLAFAARRDGNSTRGVARAGGMDTSRSRSERDYAEALLSVDH